MYYETKPTMEWQQCVDLIHYEVSLAKTFETQMTGKTSSPTEAFAPDGAGLVLSWDTVFQKTVQPNASHLSRI